MIQTTSTSAFFLIRLYESNLIEEAALQASTTETTLLNRVANRPARVHDSHGSKGAVLQILAKY